MFEDTTAHVGQTTAPELILAPTNDVLASNNIYGQTEQIMPVEPTLDAIGLTPLSVVDFPNSLNLFATELAFDNAVVEMQAVGLGSADVRDDLTGQATLNIEASAATSFSGGNYIAGTLGADRFLANLNAPLTVISGNGNVHYGSGYYDYLDLSNLYSSSVANHDWQVFDAGNGARMFDALTFVNGVQVLFEGLDGIRFADQWIDLSVDPDDPLFSSQWNLHMMGVQNAWRFTQGSDKVLIGVQDSGLGVSFNNLHPDLGSTLFSPDNVVDEFFRETNDETSGPMDDSHGTGVQGIISATANNGVGISGINWNSSVYHIDVLGNNQGDDSLAEAAQAMIDQAKNQQQKLVINMSLGGGTLDLDFERLVEDNQSDVLFIIASGNDGSSSISNPASLAQNFNNVMAVGASWGLRNEFGRETNLGQRIDYGDSYWGSNYGPGLSIMGPSEVLTTEAIMTRTGVRFGIDSDFNGTSAAAPNVAGVASLVWSANPNLTAAQVHGILAETAFDLGARGYDYEYGHGFVNADAAVRRAMAIQWQTSASNSWSNASTETDSSWVSPSTAVGQVDTQPPAQGSFGGDGWASQGLTSWSTAFAFSTEQRALISSAEAVPMAAMVSQSALPESASSQLEFSNELFSSRWNAWTADSVDALMGELQAIPLGAEWAEYSLSA